MRCVRTDKAIALKQSTCTVQAAREALESAARSLNRLSNTRQRGSIQVSRLPRYFYYPQYYSLSPYYFRRAAKLKLVLFCTAQSLD